MTRPLRVLLVSPVPERDPPTGDVTYTEELLRNPPAGVEYETYAEALAAGRLVEHASRRSQQSRRTVGERWRILHQALLNKVRSTGILWREPFRYFSVEEGAYDAIHVHVFSIRWLGPTPPIVVSNGAPQPDLYRDGYGWSQRRVSGTWAAERLLSRLLRVEQPVCRLESAAAVVTFTDHLREFYLHHRLCAPDLVATIPCPTRRSARPTLSRAPSTVGFVARNFVAKGGPTVAAAWPEIRRAHPEARLLIAGSEVPEEVERLDGVVSLGSLPRDELMSEFFAHLDVFAYPTTFDGGSLVMQEALAHAIPTVTSDYGPMPEMIGNGMAGAVVAAGDQAGLAQEVIKLLDPDHHAEVSRRTADWFDSRFADDVVRESLGRVYRRIAAP